jgi:hypothetical protein
MLAALRASAGRWCTATATGRIRRIGRKRRNRRIRRIRGIRWVRCIRRRRSIRRNSRAQSRHRHLRTPRKRLESAAQTLDLAAQIGETADVFVTRAHAAGPNQRSELFAQLLEPFAKNA